MESRTVYIRLTAKGGQHPPIINSHQVWDVDRFMASMVKQYETDPKAKNAESRRKNAVEAEIVYEVSAVTREEYLASKR